MKEILITSSALILVLLLLRRVFQKNLSRRWQYALWALVLARLLIPVSLLPAANFSVLTATAPVQQAVDQRLESMVYAIPTQHYYSDTPVQPGQPPIIDRTEHGVPAVNGAPAQSYYSGGVVIDEKGATHYLFMLPWNELLPLVWKIGMAVMGAFFLLSNLFFYHRLRKNRRPFESASPLGGGARRIYLVPEGAIPSPCLFGLFSPAIYITPAVADDPVKLRHVLAHEETHAKHLDPLWSLLRCVCLTVYWFDPLVWVAASCSKTDCELACDESALKALGEHERIGYGETLLSLIPVRKGPSNPMLAATTMTAGKKQLRDRITRIAQRPRQLMANLVAVAVLASIAAACTFTGGTATPAPSPSPSPAVSQAPEDTALRALTAEELRWFNEEYFNSSGADQTGEGGMVYNIRNQFANPINLYDRPQDIDLYELFYCDGEAVPDDELSIVWDGSREDIPCGAYKLTVGAVNDILMGYTGLTLDKTEKVGLENFTYQDYAYYWMHGDTNYPGDLEFLVGTREGDTVKLYHGSDYAGKGSRGYCVTMTDKGDGQYWFVSNQESEIPTIPTALPLWEPKATISLKDLEPVAPVAAATQNMPGDDKGSYENWFEHYSYNGGDTIWVYRSADKALPVEERPVYAGLEREDGTLDVFLTVRDSRVETTHLSALGQDHILGISYYPEAGSLSWPTWDFYIFQDHTPVRLCQAVGGRGSNPRTLDLDGDGVAELFTQQELFFLRDGLVYRADLKELVMAACPELTEWRYLDADKYGKSLIAYGTNEKYQDIVRYLYFDGENLLIYKDEKPTTDHLVDGIALNVPDAVVEQAKAYALSVYEGQSEYEGMGTLDDWRIESLNGPYQTTVGDLTVESWSFNYECHTTTPDEVVVAGGRYITEDNWVSPGYPGCDYLFFLRGGDGSLTYLWHDMMNDMGPGSPRYDQYLADKLAEVGYRQEVGSFSAAAREAEAQLNHIFDLGGGLVTLQLAPVEGEAVAYTVHADRGNGPNYQRAFTENLQYTWRYCDSFPGYPEGTSLTITDPSWEYYIRLWEGSDYVMIKPNNEGSSWYEVKQTGYSDIFNTDVFSLMRWWFDEAELDALQNNISVPDRGQGPLEIVQEWVEAYEGAYLKLTPGNHLRCTFMKPAGVGTLEDMPETWFPSDVTQYPHFAFCYDTIFVPEGSDGLHWFMAGNTGEYEGPDPEAPQGALTYSRLGSMYLKDGSWYCGGVGTG